MGRHAQPEWPTRDPDAGGKRARARADRNYLYDHVVVYRAIHGKPTGRSLCERELAEVVDYLARRGYSTDAIVRRIGVRTADVVRHMPTGEDQQ